MISRMTTVGESMPTPKRLVWPSAVLSLVWVRFIILASQFREVEEKVSRVQRSVSRTRLLFIR